MSNQGWMPGCLGRGGPRSARLRSVEAATVRKLQRRPSRTGRPYGCRFVASPAMPELLLEVVLVNLLQHEGLIILHADVVADHEIAQAFPSMRISRALMRSM
jgi:hypothetical protein